ncbi:Vesicle-associated membrane protein-associated protein B/C [Wickerhamomyces ciferrii]|uniref:Vesicle-associated membrane protein-associated protein B/C n=1 Tax=Wickerhamomyces ciferrii (strain ATCC 14091 / BCRC 22168 / CBS 111 / JCM 3599 / NBRC 0793 / NRRL Y-1031 F-60-10) TaxID=1206466 RepID=K0KZK1_WICCF|nr:Vesicle-associated membrane protein-associated protein B/C [Wickerhamomyces ciferrii]CCH46573.1 Vesicle-associated membrane protein-associated protein B/C [Wickerhamomyces ciferrii]
MKLLLSRPNAAIIEPGKSIDVSIILLGLKEEPTPDFKCNDKFLIVALPSPYDLGDKSVADIWPQLESEFKPQSISKKIKVKYVFEKVNEESSQQHQQPLQQQSDIPSSNIDESSNVSAGIGGLGSNGNSAIPDQQQDSAKSIINEKSSIPPSYNESSEQNKIDELNEKLDSNVAKSQASKEQEQNSTITKNQSVGNAPLTTVILIALIAFIVGWLFF